MVIKNADLGKITVDDVHITNLGFHRYFIQTDNEISLNNIVIDKYNNSKFTIIQKRC